MSPRWWLAPGRLQSLYLLLFLLPAELTPGGGLSAGLVGVAAVALGVVLPLGLVALAVVVLVVRRRNALVLAGLAGPGKAVPQCHHNGVGGLNKGPAAGGLGLAANPPPRRNSSLEINDGDQRYVVSYTLKAVAAAGRPDRPDILDTPRTPRTGGCQFCLEAAAVFFSCF